MLKWCVWGSSKLLCAALHLDLKTYIYIHIQICFKFTWENMNNKAQLYPGLSRELVMYLYNKYLTNISSARFINRMLSFLYLYIALRLHDASNHQIYRAF